jgi:hypothetical protein
MLVDAESARSISLRIDIYKARYVERLIEVVVFPTPPF